jgi:phosphonate transport system permease protein
MLFDIVLWGGLIVALAVSFKQVDIDNLPRLFNGSSTAGEMAGALFNPDFTRVDFFIEKMLETVMIALWGTFLALFLAIPLAFMAARNVAPAWLVWPVRRVMDLMRSVPDLVIGLIFVIIVGLGPLPGVLALALNTGGVLAKLFSEAVESIDKGPVEGVRATGARASGPRAPRPSSPSPPAWPRISPAPRAAPRRASNRWAPAAASRPSARASAPTPPTSPTPRAR